MHPAEIDRLIVRVLEELAAAGGPSPAYCTCHRRPVWHCPQGGAARAGDGDIPLLPRDLETTTASDIAALIDHTLLKPDATRSQIEAVCREAATYRFAAVCVNPVWVATCARLLQDSGIAVCTVAGFPLGATTTDTKQHEARQAILDGAREVDMVINIGALKSGGLRDVHQDIEAVASTCRRLGALSKVIIETALLTDEEKVAACTLAQAAGADYVKTSTGFGPGGATVSDVALMRHVVGPALGVKAAGGVRDLRTLRALIAAGATRLGTSAGPRIVQEEQTVRASPGHGGTT